MSAIPQNQAITQCGTEHERNSLPTPGTYWK